MVSHRNLAKQRLESHIRPYQSAVSEAEKTLQEYDWEYLMSSSDEIDAKFSVSDFKDCIPFSQKYDIEDEENHYATRLGNVGLIVPKGKWKNTFLKRFMGEIDETVAFHIESTEFTGTLGQTGLSFADSLRDSETLKKDIIHETMHSSFPKYSFYYDEKRIEFKNSKTAEDVIDSGLDYIEIDIINEINSFRSEKDMNWEDVKDVLVQDYLPHYLEDYIEKKMVENVYGIEYKKEDVGKKEKKLRETIKRVVRKSSSHLPEQVEDACSTMKRLEGKYSHGLVSHILYNSSCLEDLAGFERNDDTKTRVLESLRVYSSHDDFYKPVYDEAKKKLS